MVYKRECAQEQHPCCFPLGILIQVYLHGSSQRSSSVMSRWFWWLLWNKSSHSSHFSWKQQSEQEGFSCLRWGRNDGTERLRELSFIRDQGSSGPLRRGLLFRNVSQEKRTICFILVTNLPGSFELLFPILFTCLPCPPQMLPKCPPSGGRRVSLVGLGSWGSTEAIPLPHSSCPPLQPTGGSASASASEHSCKCFFFNGEKLCVFFFFLATH